MTTHDHNANVENKAEQNIVVGFSPRVRNDVGEQLIKFCETNNLFT